jgi:hypothetical protein
MKILKGSNVNRVRIPWTLVLMPKYKRGGRIYSQLSSQVVTFDII